MGVISSSSTHSEHPLSAWGLWSRWVIANSLGEVLGLGIAGGLGVALFSLLSAVLSVPAVATAIAMVLGGTLEGALVGVAQWVVLHRYIPRLPWRQWVLATAAGAFIAWALGMMPSTLIELSANTDGSASDPTFASLSDLTVYTLAALMGMVLGHILALVQWLVLRQYIHRAAWWILANAVAWAVGMVAIFVVAGLLTEEATTLDITLAFGLAGAVAGALVGAIHGLALVRLVRQNRIMTG